MKIKDIVLGMAVYHKTKGKGKLIAIQDSIYLERYKVRWENDPWNDTYERASHLSKRSYTQRKVT